jgi:hypothetical protein
MIYQHRTLVSTVGYDQVSRKWKYAATVSWTRFEALLDSTLSPRRWSFSKEEHN